MPRPRAFDIRQCNIPMPAGLKRVIGELAAAEWGSAAQWVVQAVRSYLDVPRGERTAVAYLPHWVKVRVDSRKREHLFIEFPESVARLVYQDTGSDRLRDLNRFIYSAVCHRLCGAREPAGV